MIDPIKTDITFYPLQFSRNRMEWQIAPAASTLTSRAGLKYFLGLRIPDFPGSGTFVTLTTLEGRERPPVVVGSSVSYPGAVFRIDEMLDNHLQRQKPSFRQTTVQLLTQLTMPYQLHQQVQGGSPVQNTDITTQTRWLFKGGIADEDTAWQETFFHVYLRDHRNFLTWQPVTKTVSVGQEEYLYFLFNFTPPATVKGRIEITYRDGNVINRDAFTVGTIPLYSVLCCPSGPAALGITGDVICYKFWLSDQDNNRLSEVRTFLTDQRCRPQQQWLLFNNSLAGWDTLRLLGRSEESVVVQRTQAQIDTFGQQSIERAELQIVDIRGDSQLTVSTGWFERDSQQMAAYLAELMYAESIYLITPKGHVPVILSNTELLTRQDDSDLIARSFTFERTKAERNFSNLPYLPVAGQSRPTGWIGVDVQPLLDAWGKRTGYQQPVRLRKVYTDTGGDFVPLTEKPNLTTDPDYIPPTVMSGVTPGTTPYSNAAISRLGTFSKSDCAQNQAGAAATISIPANRYGSEISQADADAKAENEYNALNTQLYADTYGSCVVAPFLNAAFSRLGSFIRNNCPTDKVGSYATITIAAGTWGSVLSQADADAKAVAEANALDTQAFANANGFCIVPRQTLFTGYGVTMYVDRLQDNSYKLVVSGNIIAINDLPWWGITAVWGISGGKYEKTYPASRFGTTVTPASINIRQSGGGELGVYIESFTFF